MEAPERAVDDLEAIVAELVKRVAALEAEWVAREDAKTRPRTLAEKEALVRKHGRVKIETNVIRT